MTFSDFNWGVFWAVLSAAVAVLAIYGIWRAANATTRRRRSKLQDPNYLIEQAFHDKKAFKPAAPLDELSLEELKREYAALRNLERDTSKSLAVSTKDDPQATREQIIDAAVNAFTAGGISEEEMQAMITEANRRYAGPGPSAKPNNRPTDI